MLASAFLLACTATHTARADGTPPAAPRDTTSPATSTSKPRSAAKPLTPEEAAARHGTPSLHLSWHDPHGMPRASDRVHIACGDTTRVDTLFVCMEVSKPTPGLDSLVVTLFFHPMGPDTLGSFWHFKRGWENQMNLMVDFDRVAGVAGELPWDVMGFGNVSYDHRSGRGRLDLAFSIPPQVAKPLQPGTIYTAARIRIRHRRAAEIAGCAQAVCVEAADLRLKFATGRRMSSPPGSERFVGWNTPDGPCRPPRSQYKPWRPDAK